MKLYLIASQAVYLLFMALWFTLWALSAILFDTGFTTPAVLFFCAISAYPVAAIGCSVAAWVMFRKRRRSALIVNLVPSLWVVAILSVLAYAGIQGS